MKKKILKSKSKSPDVSLGAELLARRLQGASWKELDKEYNTYTGNTSYWFGVLTGITDKVLKGDALLSLVSLVEVEEVA
jgi:hypothetical protein